MLPLMRAAFTLAQERSVPALNVRLLTYTHPCGAVHHHLASEDEHCAFVVAFRTTPENSTGLPHILEHTTLCGSHKYPVRDPFFQMLRRSLQTFMNAMTFPDMTCYPFASQVAKDYANLTDVYLDAVFKPLLNPLDFAQEGHRLELSTNGTGERKGIVFNEMKGAMDGTSEQMSAATARALLPDTCYRHNYGGEPSDIPQLSHHDLLAFHARCYRPANAVFITYGKQDPAELHARLAAYFSGDLGVALPPPEAQKPLNKSSSIDVPVPFSAGQDVLDVSAAALTWGFHDVAQLDEVLVGELLDRILLGHAGAPLRHALENSGLGRSASGSGYSGSYRSGLFTAELSGIDPSDYDKLEPVVMTCLNQLARQGVAGDEIEAALHQLELARREIHGDHYPYGLELCFRLLTPWNYGVDPLPFLDQAEAIARLREKALTPGFLNREINARFINNPHRALFFARPDEHFHERQKELEQRQVDSELAQLDAAGKDHLRKRASELAKRQASVDDPTVLPDLQLSDVPSERTFPSGTTHDSLTIFTPGTNGILHHLVALPLCELDDNELDLLPLVAQLIGQLGVGNLSYTQRAAQLNARCGGLWAWTDLCADHNDLAHLHAYLFIEIKGLATRAADFLPLLAETLAEQRFDEHDRLRELIEQSVQRLHERVQSAGNAFAARAATRGFGGAAALGHRLSGLGRLAWIKRLSHSIAEDQPQAATALEKLGQQLRQLCQKIAAQTRYVCLIGDAAGQAALHQLVTQAWSALPQNTAASAHFRTPIARHEAQTAYLTATAVNYCALAFPAVPLGHADAPGLAVAGRLLVNNILHPRIRERGGAYGSGASYAAGTGTFTLTSYRDPRLVETYADMRDALRWLSDCPKDERLLKEAILGVIAGLDSPGSPAGETRARFTGDLKGATPKRLNQFRSRILATTITDIRRVANAWLPPDGGVAAVVTGAETFSASGLEWASEQI
jgi:presequence protease